MLLIINSEYQLTDIVSPQRILAFWTIDFTLIDSSVDREKIPYHF